MIYVILWWLIIQFLGWLALPVAYRLFRWLPDRGYAFSKALGLLMVSYLLWLGSITGFLHNSLAPRTSPPCWIFCASTKAW
jgi:hypothetical protein